MISYFSFEADYFNNNGDQGNVEVLLHYLKASGVKVKRAEHIKDADFALIGDASLAVIEHFSKKLGSMRSEIRKRFEDGKPTLIVGSSYEFFSGEIGLEFSRTKRVSGFVTTPEGFFGYRNSDSTLPDVVRKDAFIATKLFGPVLAKNPQLLEIELNALGVRFEMSEEIKGWIESIRQKSA